MPEPSELVLEMESPDKHTTYTNTTTILQYEYIK